MITLARQLRDHLEAAARRAWPEETCGFLIGRSEANGPVRIDSFALSPNRARDPRGAFLLDPAMHLRLQRDLRGSPYALVGLFHSHPGGAAALSEADLEAPAPEDWLWLILALAEKAGRVETAAFRRRGSRRPEPLEIKLL